MYVSNNFVLNTGTRRAIKSYLWKRVDAMVSKGKYEGDVLEAILDSYWQNKRILSPSRRKNGDVVESLDVKSLEIKKDIEGLKEQSQKNK